jgi:hypothetical protein
MRIGSKRLGVIEVIGSQAERTDRIVSGHQTGERLSKSSRFHGQIIGTVIVVLLAGSSAFGEFLVQPLKMQIQVVPGKMIPRELFLENRSKDVTESISLRLVDVTQDPNGMWRDFAPGDPNVAALELRSCRSWLSLDTDRVDLEPLQRVPVRFRIQVPPGVNGYYFAAILAQSEARVTDVAGYTSLMVLQYVVPVIIEVQGRIVRHEVELTDVGLEFQMQMGMRPSATLATMDIENKGGTYSRLVGMTRIWRQFGGHWKWEADAKFLDTGIIPGAKLHLRQDVGRALPSGAYRVQGFLIVDGRRAGQTQKEFSFAGDPRVVISGADAALELDPMEQYVQIIPGATRMAFITVVNPAEEPVVVNADVMLPEHMFSAVSARGVKGEDYGCANWVSVDPPQFTLRGHERRNLRLTARMPDASSIVMLPDYYGVVRLSAAYADGQRAGMTKARLCVQSRNVQGAQRVDSLVFTISEAAAPRYIVTARFANSGDVHVLPVCRAVLTTLDGMTQKRILLSSEAYDQTGIMLPMETRNFSGVLDVSDVGPGTYRLTAVLEYEYDKAGVADSGGQTRETSVANQPSKARANVQTQMALDVVEEGAGKVIHQNDISKVGRVPISL